MVAVVISGTTVKYRIKHMVEYGSLRILYFWLNLLPARMALWFGVLLAALAHRVARTRVKIAHERIREVFGVSLPEREVKRIAWTSLRNTFLNAVEIIRMARMDRDWVESHIADHDQLDPLREHLRTGRGAIVVVPHMGNWDLSAVATKHLGLPVFCIVGHQKNPLTNDFMNRLRRATGIETICRLEGPLRKVLRNLRAGMVLAMMTDLRSRTSGVPVRFLGKEANVVGGLGLFARQAHVPVFTAIALREGIHKHRWIVLDPIFPDEALEKEEDARRMTQAVMDIYDRFIRQYPEQYFWYNKRWVLEPYSPEPCTEPIPFRDPVRTSASC